MHLRVILLVSLSSILGAVAKRCKCLPTDPCFPNSTAWDALSQQLTEPVNTNQRPLAAACYEDGGIFDSNACAQSTSANVNPEFRASLSQTSQFINYEQLETPSGIQSCPFAPASNATCQQGRVPSYAITAHSVSDIQHTVAFASDHDLHLVIKNSGHDLGGRSFGQGSVELFTLNLKGMNFTDSFVPQGAPGDVQGQPAATVGAGISWHELYEAAEQNGKTVAGGFSAGAVVGAAGGWPLGGGHSVLSPFYGLGVDNVLEMNVVLPNSSFVTANPYQNTDLFWALRGGGGSNFGVLTSLTYKAHESVSYTTAYFVAGTNSTAAYESLLELWASVHNAMADAGWTGLWPFFGGNLWLTLFTQGTPPMNPAASSAFTSFVSAAQAIPGVNVTLSTTKDYPNFFAWVHDQLLLDGTGAIGFNFTTLPTGAPTQLGNSWLLPRSLTEPSNAATLAKLFSTMVGSGFLVGGGAVSKVDPDSAAVGPAWRTALTDMVVLPPWSNDITPEANYQVAKAQIDPLKALAPPPLGGRYYNEPDMLEENWSEAVWGSHYPRLLALKREVDPKDLFIVYQGPNSEGWDKESVCKQ